MHVRLICLPALFLGAVVGVACEPQAPAYRAPTLTAGELFVQARAECNRYPERCPESSEMLTGEAIDRQLPADQPAEDWTAPAEGCPTGCRIHVAGCDIKGNISFDTGEKIYHLPGDAYYQEAEVNPQAGERWFCTEAEAQANGWRRTYAR